MKRFIHVTKEDREFIMRAFGCTERMVFIGIRFEKDTELAKRIQKLALERGGIVMVELPEMQCLHDADGYMRQYLPGGTLLEFSFKDGGCEVWHKGEKVRRYENVAVSSIPDIQNWAMALR